MVRKFFVEQGFAIFKDFINRKMQINSNQESWTVSKLKSCQLSKLTEPEKLKLKQNRPTPNLSIEQEFISKGLFF